MYFFKCTIWPLANILPKHLIHTFFFILWPQISKAPWSEMARTQSWPFWYSKCKHLSQRATTVWRSDSDSEVFMLVIKDRTVIFPGEVCSLQLSVHVNVASMQNLLANDQCMCRNGLLCPLSVPFLLVCLLLWLKRTFLTVGRVKRAGIQVWDPGRGSVHCLMWSVPEGLWHMEDITYPAGPERNHGACKHTATTAHTNSVPSLMSGPDCVFYGFS